MRFVLSLVSQIAPNMDTKTPHVDLDVNLVTVISDFVRLLVVYIWRRMVTMYNVTD